MAAEPERGIRFLSADGTAESDAGFCDRNLNLLAHAQSIELDIGSRCGGHGICGGDRVRIAGGPGPGGSTATEPALSPVTDREREHLSAEELAAGWRLACQCFPERSSQSLRVKTLA